MPKRTSDSARILNFFSEADLGKASVLYDLVRDVMGRRLAPARAEAKKKRQAKKVSPVLSPAERQAMADRQAMLAVNDY